MRGVEPAVSLLARCVKEQGLVLFRYGQGLWDCPEAELGARVLWESSRHWVLNGTGSR